MLEEAVLVRNLAMCLAVNRSISSIGGFKHREMYGALLVGLNVTALGHVSGVFFGGCCKGRHV